MDIVNATRAAIENECAITRPKLSKENIAIMPERCYKVNAYQIIDTAKSDSFVNFTLLFFIINTSF